MKIEMHAHTSPVSPCARLEPPQFVQAYEAAGYDAVVLTNHYSEYSLPDLGDTLPEKIENYLADYRECVRLSSKVKIFLGAEVAIFGPKSRCEFLLYGLDEEFLREAPCLIDLSQKELYTLAHAHGVVMVQAHPFRSEFRMVPQDPEYMDGVEINCHPAHLREEEKVLDFACKHNLLVTAGSDFHGDAMPTAGIVSDKLVADVQALAQTLRSGEYEYFFKK